MMGSTSPLRNLKPLTASKVERFITFSLVVMIQNPFDDSSGFLLRSEMSDTGGQ